MMETNKPSASPFCIAFLNLKPRDNYMFPLFLQVVDDSIDPISLARKCADLCRRNDTDKEERGRKCGFFNFQVKPQ
jgi:hypothetical protein